MENFEFKTNFTELDYRSVFANRVLKLIYQKHNGNLEEAVKEAEPYFDDFESLIRNIYELVENEIPLYAYYKLLKHGADNYGFNGIEFTEKIAKTREACALYYA